MEIRMRILVTGAGGRIGRRVPRELVHAGREVAGVYLVPPADRACCVQPAKTPADSHKDVSDTIDAIRRA